MIFDHTTNKISYKEGGCTVEFQDSEDSKSYALTCNTLSLNAFNSFIGTGYMAVDPNIPIVFVNSLKICNAFYQSICKTGVVNATIQLHTSCPTNWIGTGGSNSRSLVLQLPPTGELIPNDIGLTFKAINLSSNNSHMCFKQGATDIIFAGQGCVATVIWDGQHWNGFNF
jgi:hypothetical protein